MINAGIDKNFQDIYGYTAIHRSAQRGTSKVADLLVKSKADLNIRDNNGYTPYKRALESDHRVRFEVVLVLNGKKVSGDLIEDHNQDSIEPDYRGKMLKLKGKSIKFIITSMDLSECVCLSCSNNIS